MRKELIPAPALAPASALVWWIVGYLPWLVGGLGGDIEGVDIYSIAYDAVTLPLVLPELPMLVLGGLVGGACAGLLTNLTDGRAVTSLAASFAGVACAVLLAGIQSTSALRDASVPGYEGDDTYGPALVAAAAGASLLGWCFGAGGYFGRVPLGLALAVLAGALPVWLGRVVFAIDRDVRLEILGLSALSYAGAALLTLGLVVVGIRPYARLLAWPGAVALAWLVAPAHTVAAFLGSVARSPGEMGDLIGRAWDIAELEVQPASYPPDVWLPFVVAIGLALAIAVRFEMRRGTRDDAGEDHSPVEPSNSSRTTSR